MAKRKAISLDDSDFEAPGSELSDYTPSSAKSKSKSKSKPAGAGRKRAKRIPPDEDEGLAGEMAECYNLPTHGVTLHTIGARVAPMQTALLAWFERVYDARKMPWRKPFDASANADARSQRAYEVLPFYKPQ